MSSSDASRRARDLFVGLNCNQSMTNSELLTCAQSANADEVLNGVYSYMPTLPYIQDLGNWSWGNAGELFNNPTIDDILFNQSMDKIIKLGQVKKCKIITGFNSNEYVLFLIGSDPLDQVHNYGYTGFHFKQFLYWISKQFFYYPSYPTKPDTNFASSLVDAYFKTTEMAFNYIKPIYTNYFIQMLSDFWFVCQSFQIAEVYSKYNSNAYVYEFKYRGSNTWLPKFLGTATHGDELFYTFAGPLSNPVSMKRFFKENFILFLK